MKTWKINRKQTPKSVWVRKHTSARITNHRGRTQRFRNLAKVSHDCLNPFIYTHKVQVSPSVSEATRKMRVPAREKSDKSFTSTKSVEMKRRLESCPCTKQARSKTFVATWVIQQIFRKHLLFFALFCFVFLSLSLHLYCLFCFVLFCLSIYALKLPFEMI